MIDLLPEWHRIEELVTACQLRRCWYDLGTCGKTDYPITMVDIPQIDVVFNINSTTIFREWHRPVAYPV